MSKHHDWIEIIPSSATVCAALLFFIMGMHFGSRIGETPNPTVSPVSPSPVHAAVQGPGILNPTVTVLVYSSDGVASERSMTLQQVIDNAAAGVPISIREVE